MLKLSDKEIEDITDIQIDVIKVRISEHVSPPSNDQQWIQYMNDVIGFAFSYGMGYTIALMEKNELEMCGLKSKENVH